MTPPFTLQALTGPGEPRAVEARECSRCPAYVVRCAHLDGDDRVVWLLDYRLWRSAECPQRAIHDTQGTWMAAIGHIGTAMWCNCPGTRGDYYDTDDRAEAEAAYERFEAILLGRTAE